MMTALKAMSNMKFRDMGQIRGLILRDLHPGHYVDIFGLEQVRVEYMKRFQFK